MAARVALDLYRPGLASDVERPRGRSAGTRATATRMNAALSKVRADWLAANPFKSFPPVNLCPPLRPRGEITADDRERIANRRCDVDDKLNQHDPDIVRKGRTTYRQRREIEERLADYLRDNMATFEAVRALREAPAKLCACRRSGDWGERIEGDRRKIVIGWDFKCGLTRLCPDEARAEQRRLVRRYKQPIIDWKYASPWRRVQKAVLTWPNAAPGALAKMKREQMKTAARLIKEFRAIKGATVTQEDPLSARGDWNVHLNLIFLIEGAFDWDRVRARWTELSRPYFPSVTAASYSCDFQQLPRFDDRELERAITQSIKYAVKHVTEKQDSRFSEGGLGVVPDRVDDPQAGATPAAIAPGMIDWPPERFLEWWNAGLGFRRTRSYGALFRVNPPERERGEVVWYGRVEWEGRARAYRVLVADRLPRPVVLTQAYKSPPIRGPTSRPRAGPPLVA